MPLKGNGDGRAVPAWSSLVAGLVVVAGILHLTVLQAHLAESRGAGLYFLALGTMQVLWGARFLLRPSSRSAGFGLAFLALAPVVLWVMTRLLRSPWGVGPEAVDTVGLATTALELAAAGFLIWARLGRITDSGSAARRGVAVVVAVGLLVGAGSYASAMVAESSIPWLAEPDMGHAHGETVQPSNGTVASDGHAHAH